MTPTILTFRVTRRALAAACIRSGEASLVDGRFLSGPSERAVAAAVRYIERLLALTQPTTVVIDAPRSETSSLSARLTVAIETLAREQQRVVMRLERHEILEAFGVQRVVDRRHLRELIAILWPETSRVTSRVQPYVADAAAAALFGETVLALTPPRT